MTDSSGSVFLFEGIKRGLCRIADYSAILQQPLCCKNKYYFFCDLSAQIPIAITTANTIAYQKHPQR